MRSLRLAVLAVWLAAFILYAATAGPSIVALFDDSLEFQLIAPILGIAHPTGYPLYVLLGWLWSRLLLPVGNWAWRMNLFSAFCAATAISLIFLAGGELGRRLNGRLWPGLGAALAYALSPVWWGQATLAEVYALHGLFVAAIIVLALRIERQAVTGASGTGPLPPGIVRSLTWLFLATGFSLAHHRTTLLLVPPLAIYLLWSVPGLWRPRAAWWQWGAALLAPLLLYLLIPLRAHMGSTDLHGSYVNSWSGFWDHVLASGYATFFGGSSLAWQRTPGTWWDLLVQQFGLITLAVAILGLNLWWVPGLRRAVTFLTMVLAANFLFALRYGVADVEVFLLPVFLCVSLLVGAGVAVVAWLLGRDARVALAGQIFLVILIALGPLGRQGGINRSGDWAVHNYAVEMAKVDFPPGSAVVALEGEASALRFMQQAAGLGQNATPIVADDPQRRREIVATLVAEGRPTYLTRELEGIEGLYSFSAAGPLVRIWSAGTTQTGDPSHPLDLTLQGMPLCLEGYDLEWLSQPGDPAVRMTFYWRPLAPLERRLKVSLRVLDETGNPLTWPGGASVVEDRFPLQQVAYSDQWRAGEQILDVQTVPVPSQAAARADSLSIIFYEADTIQEVGRWEVDLTAIRPQAGE